VENGTYEIRENINIADRLYKMILFGNGHESMQPGQFIDIALPGFYLRRPISVCDCGGESITIIYKTVGAGTEYMAALAPGEKLDVLTGLGNGFDTSLSGRSPLLIGGGAGCAPLYLLAKKLVGEGKKPAAILGFNTASEVFFTGEFENLGVSTIVATVDGTFGIKGFPTDAVEKFPGFTFYYTCGPEPMMRAVYKACPTSGQLSFEERMGCGIGACMGCSCKTLIGYKRICREGPVMMKEELLWS